ncbi:hypothetical protein [Halobellus marinus]|jgi:hypothetical protein|uniref:hypothetical protein n=1 Tax=Halobellus TaxID=1073986 RepID=UPI0028A9F9B7|nr:hypothetical protein [Halobellus sp. DFY28]
MAVQTEMKEAADSGREDLIRTLAEHRVLPTTIEQSGSSLLGGSTATYRFESEESGESVADRQTSARAADTLGLTGGEDCESVREEIQAHDAWSES